MRFVHFVDDATVSASDSEINNVHATVNKELVGVDNWLKTNILALNVCKTSYMIISNHENSLGIIQSLRTFQQSNSLVLVTLDENFTFNVHINKCDTKISKSLSVMMKYHCQLPADVICKLFYSLVYSHLTFSLLAWGWSGRAKC